MSGDPRKLRPVASTYVERVRIAAQPGEVDSEVRAPYNFRAEELRHGILEPR